MKNEKVILPNLKAAEDLLSTIGLNPDRAWHNSTRTKGVRQLHIGIKRNKKSYYKNMGYQVIRVRFWIHFIYWLNIYYYSHGKANGS